MDIMQCTICKKPFQSLGRKICNSCLEQIDRDFITVRDYIYEHERADIDEVTEETGVKKQVIIHLLKEGRLTIEDKDGGGGGTLFCEVCRKPINTGRLCKDCKDKVASRMQKNIDTHKPAGSGGNGSANFKGSAKLKS